MSEQAPKDTGLSIKKRDILLIGIGAGVGIALGALLTMGAFATVSLVTNTIPATRDSALVFNELNELRQQINEMNEKNSALEQEKEAAARQALAAVTSTVRPPAGVTPEAVRALKEQSAAAPQSQVAKSSDPFAEVDAEVKKLEQTQKVLNTILDMFSKQKEPAKDR
jgi:hypothetical protein